MIIFVGDGKELVRDKTVHLLLVLMEKVVKPQTIFEKMVSAFSHKNAKVREEVMVLLQNSLNK